jgi:putative membrane protein
MKHIINFFKGIAIGISIIIPGVSGGTMAIIVGLYDKIIHAVSAFFKDIRNNFIFLAVIGLGTVSAILGFSQIIKYALDNFRFATIFLFLGIICGGFPVLYKKAEIKKTNIKSVILLLLSVAAVVAMSFLQNDLLNAVTGKGIITTLIIITVGFFTAIAFILPGISGSFFLYVVGLYETTLAAVDIRNLDFSYLLPFALGTLIGIIFTAKMLENLLKRYTHATYMVIMGLVAGSAIVIFKGNIPYGINILVSIIAAITGFFLTHFFTKAGEKITKNN